MTVRRLGRAPAKLTFLTGAALALALASAAHAQTPPAPSPDGLAQGELYMEADLLTRDDTAHRTTAEGNIEVRYNGRTLRADRLVYEDGSGVVRAYGNITIINPDGTAEFADEVMLDDELRTGVALGFSARLPDNVKIAAASAIKRSESIKELNRAIYTPCEVCAADGTAKTPTWSISASKVVRDREGHTVSYRDARFRLFGATILYLPVFWHADPDAKRASGFLVPRAGISDRRGLSYEQPYYWVVSPYSDLIISPQFNSKVSPFLNLRGRQSFYSGILDLRLGYTHDRDFDGRGNEIPGTGAHRSYILGRGAFKLDEKWRWGFTAERTSDDLIFDKYEVNDVYESRGPYVADDRRLISQVYAIRQTPRSYISAAAISIQGLRPEDIDRTFPSIGPLTEVNYEPGLRVAGGRIRLEASSVGLYRDQSPTTPELRLPGLDSRRLTGSADWRRPFTSPAGLRLEAFAAVRGDAYDIDDILTGVGRTVTGKQVGRVLATAGADIGYPLFRRVGTTSVIIEPVVQVVASPDAKQVIVDYDAAGHPIYLNEDSVAFEFDETTLFRPNKFPGYDLYEDGVRVNIAARAAVLWEDGRRANFLLGRAFRSQENLVFPERSGLRGEASDWVVAADAQPFRGVSMFARARLDSESLDIHRLETGANVTSRYGTGFVRYLTDDFDINGAARANLDVGGELYLGKSLGVSAYGNRDVGRDAWVIRDLGVFYRDDCLRVDVVYRREDVIIGRLLPSESISVRLTLATLGGPLNAR